MSIIIFLIVLSVLVFVHELGHFLFAKKNGIRVDEFAIGFPPRLFAFKKGETTYAINLLPLGGYVKIFGENPDEESLNGPDKARSFVNKSKLAQASVLIAGILFNVLFAWVLFISSFMVGVANISENEEANSKLLVTAVLPDSPALYSGIKPGDQIISLSDTEVLKEELTPEAVRAFISSEQGKQIEISLKRGQEALSVSVTPKQNENGEYLIGIQMAQVSEAKLPFHKAVLEGTLTTLHVIKETVVGTLGFLWKVVTFNAEFENVAGPVGIAGLVGEASKFGFGYILSFAALISINLAVINLIPFPALDGGRLLFVALEAVIRRPIPSKVANALNLIGFAFLLLLMIVITFSDIKKLI